MFELCVLIDADTSSLWLVECIQIETRGSTGVRWICLSSLHHISSWSATIFVISLISDICGMMLCDIYCPRLSSLQVCSSYNLPEQIHHTDTPWKRAIIPYHQQNSSKTIWVLSCLLLEFPGLLSSQADTWSLHVCSLRMLLRIRPVTDAVKLSADAIKLFI